MSELSFIYEHDEAGGVFRAFDGEVLAGSISFLWDDGKKIIIDHTIVSEDFNGKGIGKALVNKAADFARSEGYKVFALCSYAAKQFQKEPELAQLLDQPEV